MIIEDLKIEQSEVCISENELNRKRVQLITALLEIETLLRNQNAKLLEITQNDRKEEVVWKEAA